jgi:hypothetical protein
MADTNDSLTTDQSQPVPWLSGGAFDSALCDECATPLAQGDEWGLCRTCRGPVPQNPGTVRAQ